ncbi:translation initiation factor eIF-2A [Eremomyces bilateralis CBS 781.70]|uniref:Eukaryotic translation initiation factor 2A n=1 Tax=Eremomyces bilateralis CBS 781.70 TaxID=1392243 RepID=A0A6G1FXZ2_9PEZI|nr:translation initiation factor eIF-2A [Eremomyces bilateralis CBS 781.70]KAF1810663.1 translation initiation factor eIF-2A [Eremomyces bilateralis CBS 781.70]
MAEPTQFAYRTAKAIGVVNASPLYEPLPAFQRPEGNLRCSCYSTCGRFFAWASPEQVTVIDASVGHITGIIPIANVFEIGFSPLGTYIITWQRPAKDEDGNAIKNLKVWQTIEDVDGSEKQVVGQFVQRSQTGWNLQYASDEKLCARVVTNEVQFYESVDLRTVWNKLIVEGVTDFALSSGKQSSVAVFVPERKGQPAAVKVFNVPNFGQPVSQKNFFKADKVQLKWNDLGTSVIVLAQTDVDKTNKSYYGETNMYILSANGGFDARVQLDKEGPIHDVSWSPNSKEFGVVYGYMPAKTTIFNVRAVAKHSFPLSPRNTILFSPHGKFVLVAGFGNLAGQMDIYDMTKDYAKVTTVEASNATFCEWSPDGKHILTATTSPRLRVDNGVRVWHVGGGLMYNEDMQELYSVCWRPQSSDKHPLGDPLNPVPTPHPSALAYLSTRKQPTKPAGAYRPPGARGTSTPLHFKREDEGGAAYVSNGASAAANGFGAGRARTRFVPGADPTDALPPGAAPGGGVSLAGAIEGPDEGLSKAALKNRKKREAKKAKEAAEKANPSGDIPRGPRSVSRSPERRGRRQGHEHTRSQGGGFQGHGTHHRGGSRNRQQHGGEHPHQHTGNAHHHAANGKPSAPAPLRTAPQQSAVEAPDLQITSPGGGVLGQSPADKKIRGLLKKVRAIDELKMRQAGGEKLEDTQVKKIATEEGIRRELDGLGYSGAV